MTAPKRILPSALVANRWKRGQSGNPSGHSGEYGQAMRLARQAAPYAVHRLIALMDSEDERVAGRLQRDSRSRVRQAWTPEGGEGRHQGAFREYDPGGAAGGNAEAAGVGAAVYAGRAKATAPVVTVRSVNSDSWRAPPLGPSGRTAGSEGGFRPPGDPR
jgi:hypothetical protein